MSKSYLVRWLEEPYKPWFLRAPKSQRETSGASWVADPALATVFGSEDAALTRYRHEQSREAGLSNEIHEAFRARWIGIAFAECPAFGLREHRVGSRPPECRPFRNTPTTRPGNPMTAGAA